MSRKTVFVLFFITCSSEFVLGLEVFMENITLLQENTKYVKMNTLELVKKGEKNALNLNFTLPDDMPGVMLNLNIFAKMAGKYKSVPLPPIKRDMCLIFKAEFKLIADQLADAVVPKDCPIKAGTYHMMGFQPDAEQFASYGKLPWDHFKLLIKFTVAETNEVISEIEVFSFLKQDPKAKSILVG